MFDPSEVSIRRARRLVLAAPRPDAGEPAGVGRRHAVPLRDLLPLSRTRSGESLESRVAGAGAFQEADRDADRPRRDLLARRGVPPAVPGEERPRDLRDLGLCRRGCRSPPAAAPARPCRRRSRPRAGRTGRRPGRDPRGRTSASRSRRGRCRCPPRPPAPGCRTRSRGTCRAGCRGAPSTIAIACSSGPLPPRVAKTTAVPVRNPIPQAAIPIS